MSVDTVKIAHLTGQFVADPDQPNVMTAHMIYRTNEGRTGEIVWSPDYGSIDSGADMAKGGVRSRRSAPAGDRASLDGEYRVVITPDVFPDVAPFEMIASVDGPAITGAGNAREIASRANGSRSMSAARW